jgi:hypothetical protein
MGQLSATDRLAAGVHAPPGLMAEGFATTQAAWRFYGNERVGLPLLCEPLIDHARRASAECCGQRTLVVLDWCNLHYDHASKPDRVTLSNGQDQGYKLLTALAVSDQDGTPLAPVCLELRAADGMHSTRQEEISPAASVLDGLGPVMNHVAGQSLAKPPVFVIDKEADSVGHYRIWSAAKREFVVRANDTRRALHNGRERKAFEIANELRPQMQRSRQVLHKGKLASQFVIETTVVLTRPAYEHRVVTKGKKKVQKRRVVVGAPLSLRLVVAEVRDDNGRMLARWMLLTNVASSSADASTIALWYYWRWKIESYHKLLKGAGQHLEQWRQETAGAIARRLLVTAMSGVVVWQLARDKRPEAGPLREMLVRLSGRQLDRSRNKRGCTEPILLAGLNVLVPMLGLLETMTVQQVRQAAGPVMQLIRGVTGTVGVDSG